MERGAGLFEYVESHIHLRQTFMAARLGSGGFGVAEAADSAELGVQRGFKYG